MATTFEPAFTEYRKLASFVPDEVLAFDGRSAVVKGTLSHERNEEPLPQASATTPTTKMAADSISNGCSASSPSATALVCLTQKPPFETPESLLAELPHMHTILTNHSGAEYSYYDAFTERAETTDSKGEDSGSSSSSSSSSSGGGARFNIEVIWPASEGQVQRKRRAEFILFEEDAETYRNLVAPFAEKQADKTTWIDKVCRQEKERERCLYNNDDFVVVVDTKWQDHARMAIWDASIASSQEDGDSHLHSLDEAAFYARERAEWHGAPWTQGLYLLAIAKDPKLKSIRDLRGEVGAAICDAMARELLTAAERVYGVPAHKCRVFFHYHPQFYRLHAHCNRIEYVNPGCEVERAHLLSTVAANLRIAEGYYADIATLTYKLRNGEKLYKLLLGNPPQNPPEPEHPPPKKKKPEPARDK